MNPSGVEILLVEDNAADVELALFALEQNHISSQIQVVRDGAEALDYMFGNGAYRGRSLEQGPKLVLLDLKLPKIDGLEVLRQIKVDPRTKRVPVVVLTTSRDERDLDTAYALGANSYLIKPIDFERFTDAVRSLGVYWLELNQLPHAQDGS